MANTTDKEPKVEPTKETKSTDLNASLLEAITRVADSVSAIDRRLNKIETGGVNEFKEKAVSADIAKASESKKNVSDTRVIDIVEKTLGTDIGIDLEGNKDNPGFMFTLIIPKRLSLLPPSSRPIVDPETKQYKKDAKGDPIEEVYHPEDRRSVAVSSIHSYDMIQKHCDRVKANLVATYTKLSQPVPEFRVKQTHE